MSRTALTILAAGLLAVPSLQARQAPQASQAGTGAPIVLAQTNHPQVSRDPSQLWLAPSATRPSPHSQASIDLAAGIKLQANGEYTKALPLLSRPAVQRGLLGDYGLYYAAAVALKLAHVDDAKRAFQSLEDRKPAGYLALAAPLGEAAADEAASDFSAAAATYERLLNANLGATDDLLMRLGKAARAGGDTTKASDAFSRVYYEFPLSDLAPAAGLELRDLPYFEAIAPGTERFRLELDRADKLFSARQYVPARAIFEALRPNATDDDKERVQLRLAECDYSQKHARIARDSLRPYLDHASRQAEAMYFYAIASLDAGDKPAYLKTLRQVADQFPAESWAEESLDSLASYDVQQDDDDQADALFREIYAKYSKGAYAEHAAWKVGWRSYRAGQYAETVRYFEQAAHDFPRSDYRPAWLYWTARAHEQLHEDTLADDRYKLVLADYLNTYYGHLTVNRLNGWMPPPRVILAADAGPSEGAAGMADANPPNGPVIRELLNAGLYDDALNELRFAARTWRDSSVVEATIAWVQRQQGRSERGTEQWNLYRGSINTMKRAYPQYLAAGGEQLPRELLDVIYPVAYWDTIRKYSAASDIDPYLMVALVAQESTFVPDIKSYASAVGLMQFMAPTARQYARKLKLPYSARLMTNPEASIRMGTAYFSDLVKSFGEVYLALAAYNAGPANVRRWMAERPTLDREEFIDDIPWPQTQNYVKKLISTAEDYRRLYTGAAAHEEDELTSAPAVKKAPPPRAPSGKTPATKSAVKRTPARQSSASRLK